MGRRSVSPETQKARIRAREREKKRKKREQLYRQNPALKKQEQERNTEARRKARQDPVYRRLEQSRNTAARRLARQDPVRRLKERERDTAARRIARQDPVRRRKERERNTIARWLSRQLQRDSQVTCDVVQGKLHLKRSDGALQNVLQKIVSETTSLSTSKEICTICHKEIKGCSPMFSSLPENQLSLYTNVCPEKYQVKFKGRNHVLCSDECVGVFCCVNNIRTSNCDTCRIYFEETPRILTVNFEGCLKKFCSKNCFNFFILSHRKLTQCNWCKGTKYNFNMLECIGPSNVLQWFCCVHCLSVSRASTGASSSQSVQCDNCHKVACVQFHLAMSDMSLRNFCSYECTTHFQSHYGGFLTSFIPAKVVGPPPSPELLSGKSTMSSLLSLPFPSKQEQTVSTTMPAFPQHVETSSVPPPPPLKQDE